MTNSGQLSKENLFSGDKIKHSDVQIDSPERPFRLLKWNYYVYIGFWAWTNFQFCHFHIQVKVLELENRHARLASAFSDGTHPPWPADQQHPPFTIGKIACHVHFQCTAVLYTLPTFIFQFVCSSLDKTWVGVAWLGGGNPPTRVQWLSPETDRYLHSLLTCMCTGDSWSRNFILWRDIGHTRNLLNDDDKPNSHWLCGNMDENR